MEQEVYEGGVTCSWSWRVGWDSWLARRAFQVEGHAERQRETTGQVQGTVSIFLAGTEAAWEADRRLAGDLGSDHKDLICQATEFTLDTTSVGKGWCQPLQRAQIRRCLVMFRGSEGGGEKGTGDSSLSLLIFPLNFYEVLY